MKYMKLDGQGGVPFLKQDSRLLTDWLTVGLASGYVSCQKVWICWHLIYAKSHGKVLQKHTKTIKIGRNMFYLCPTIEELQLKKGDGL